MVVLGALLTGALLVDRAGASEEDVARWLALGDAAYDRRAENADGAVAAPEPIAEATAAYERALEVAPERLDVRVRLLRALSFQGQYAEAGEEAKRAIFDRGRSLFEESVALVAPSADETPDHDPDAIASSVGAEPHAGELFYWGAVHWGLWGEAFGNLAAVKKGVAKKVRDCGEVARRLAPEYEGGGPYRLLGRMHAVAPRVPLFTGWVDHRLAIEYLEEAYELAPDDPMTRWFLGEALIEHGRSGERDRGLVLLQSAAEAEPRSGHEVEDARAIGEAKKSLDARRPHGRPPNGPP